MISILWRTATTKLYPPNTAGFQRISSSPHVRFKMDRQRPYWVRKPDLCPHFFRKYLPGFGFWSLVYLEVRLPPILTRSTFLLWVSATHSCQQLTLQLSSHSVSINHLSHSKYIHWRSVPQSWRTAWVPYMFFQYSPLQWVRQFLALSVHGSLKISSSNPFTHHCRIIFSSLPRPCSGSALCLFSPSLW